MENTKSTKKYLRDTIIPYFVGFKLSTIGIIQTILDNLKIVQDKLTGIINRIKFKAMSNYNKLDTLIDVFVDTYKRKYTTSYNTFQKHIENTNNPHGTKLKDFILVSTLKPNNSQGKLNDIWIEYVDSYVVNPDPTIDVRWVYSNWSGCSAPCGGGTKYKAPICMTGITNLSDSVCIAAGKTKPANITQSCNTQTCLNINTSTCNFTCTNTVVSNTDTLDYRDIGGKYIHFGSFTMVPTQGHYYWRFPFSCHLPTQVTVHEGDGHTKWYYVSPAISLALGITSSIRTTIYPVKILCAKPTDGHSTTTATASSVTYSSSNNNGSISGYVLARIPREFVGADGIIHLHFNTSILRCGSTRGSFGVQYDLPFTYNSEPSRSVVCQGS